MSTRPGGSQKGRGQGGRFSPTAIAGCQSLPALDMPDFKAFFRCQSPVIRLHCQHGLRGIKWCSPLFQPAKGLGATQQYPILGGVI